MSKIAIIIIALGMSATTNVLAAGTPMQCNLTCNTDFSTPASTAASGAADGAHVPVSVDELIARQNTGAVTGIPLSADAGSTATADTGGFDFTTECVQYTGKIWAWREGKCKSMSPDWQSPGLGNFIKR